MNNTTARPATAIRPLTRNSAGLPKRVRGRDGGLELVRPGWAAGERPGEQLDAFVDLGALPQGAILPVQGHQRAVRVRPCQAAGVGQQEQGQQAGDLCVSGAQAPARSARASSGPDVVVYPSLKIR